MRTANGSPGSISKHSFRRLSLNISQLAVAERDSDDEFSEEEEEVAFKSGDVSRNIEDTTIGEGSVPTSSQQLSSFNERVWSFHFLVCHLCSVVMIFHILVLVYLS